MNREVLDVRRCSRCHSVLTALLQDDGLTEGGEPYRAIYWGPRRSHSADDCSRMVELAREEWPTLW